MQIAIIGGGAAGFFAALVAAEHYPEHQYHIFEKSPKLLSKVKISGGGRCNVTHACFEAKHLLQHYPRGAKLLKVAFAKFMPQDLITWLAKRQVTLKTEADGRMFPITDNSQTIIDCFLQEAERHKIQIHTSALIKELVPENEGFTLKITQQKTMYFDRVAVCTGGSPQEQGLAWLQQLGYTIEKPVPSLFSFNMPQNPITQLMGINVEKAVVRVESTKWQSEGALLITHWGMSGPAILKLSAWGARDLADKQYQMAILVKWLPEQKEDNLRNLLQSYKLSLAKRQIDNKNPFFLPTRLWCFLLEKIQIPLAKKWADLSKNDINKIVNILLNDRYEVKGKTTFKEEFVTCGGVALSNIHWETMESKLHKGLFFAGEVLDIDGVTGGFNFQAAWSTAYLVGINIGK